MKHYALALVLGLTTLAPPAQASWRQCLCTLTSPQCGPDTIVGLPRGAEEHLRALDVGDVVKARVGRHVFEARVLDITFEHVLLEQVGVGEQPAFSIPHGKFKDIEVTQLAETPTVSARARRMRYLDFARADHWDGVKKPLIRETIRLRAMPKSEREAYLRAVGDTIMTRVRERFPGVSEFGFHFNLNGGQGFEYVDAGGIRASIGDVAINYGHGDLSPKIYFFRSSRVSLYDILDTRHPKLIFGGRMGNFLSIFALDAPLILAGLASGRIKNPGPISFDFAAAGAIGIPYSTFLAPPLRVFDRVGDGHLRELGRLTRDEETLATMRYIEAILMSRKDHVR